MLRRKLICGYLSESAFLQSKCFKMHVGLEFAIKTPVEAGQVRGNAIRVGDIPVWVVWVSVTRLVVPGYRLRAMREMGPVKVTGCRC